MGYKTKVDLVTDKTIKLGGEGNPSKIEGYFLGTKTTPDSGYGPGQLHIFKTKEGNVGVWGKTNLNRILTPEHRGQMVLVSFTGMGAKKKGRNPAYNYELKYDEENTIDVSNINIQDAGETEESDDSESLDSTSESEIDDSYSDDESDDSDVVVQTKPVAAPKKPATAPDASRVARVQALLAKSRA